MNALRSNEFFAPSQQWGTSAERVPHKVHRKTLAGHNALEDASLKLRPEEQRLLSMVNGRLSDEQLAATVRSGEGGALLRQLEANGWIESVTTSPRFAVDAAAVEDCLVEHRFYAARAAAESAARALLGTHFPSYANAFASCTNSRELRPLVQSISDRLSRTLGSDASAVFIESVRDAANHSTVRM